MVDSLVDGVTVYPNNVAVVNRSTVPYRGDYTSRRRGKIVELSSRARARMLFVAMTTSVEFRSMLTVTYPQEFPTSGQVVKGHLDAILKSLSDRYGLSYFWFLEFQTKRGAPHIHILLTRPNVFSADRQWFALRWAEIIGLALGRRYCSISDRREKDMWLQTLRVNTHPSTWQEIRDEGGARKYVAKYACKPEQKEVPERFHDVGRFFGYSVDVKARIRPLETFSMEADVIREVLADEGHKASEWDFLPKYLFGVETFAELTRVL